MVLLLEYTTSCSVPMLPNYITEKRLSTFAHPIRYDTNQYEQGIHIIDNTDFYYERTPFERLTICNTVHII